MATQYSIQAFSAKANQKVREFTLDKLRHVEVHNPVLAQQRAESFAMRLNQQGYLGVNDWTARVTLIATGMGTLGS